MRLSANQFARLTATICGIADESCSGRVVAITEGGYDLAGFAGCLRAVIPVLNGETSLADHVAPLPAEAQTAVAGRGHSTIDAVVPGLRQFWQLSSNSRRVRLRRHPPYVRRPGAATRTIRAVRTRQHKGAATRTIRAARTRQHKGAATRVLHAARTRQNR